MELLYQLSYNGVPVTCSGTDQVVFEAEREDSGLGLAIFSSLGEDLVFTIELARSSTSILG